MNVTDTNVTDTSMSVESEIWSTTTLEIFSSEIFSTVPTQEIFSSIVPTVLVTKDRATQDEIAWIVVLSVVGFSGLLCLFCILFNKKCK